MTILAYDRTGSVRSFDDNGRLRVERTPISKANICLYQGREIPDHARLGLNPDQSYRLLRDPKELEKAADSFNSLPVLEEHVPTSADAHPRELTVGSTMDNARFESPYLTVGMVIFDGPAITRIQSGDQKELSCGYAYEADMTPGTHEGQPYDGRMVNIRGNHIALVTKGRAGPDVLVHDSSATGKAATTMTRKDDTPTAKAPRHEEAESALNEAIQKALSADRALRQATEEARRLVRPLVGEVHGMESADDVYRYALRQSGMAADSLAAINQAGLHALVQTRLEAMTPPITHAPAADETATWYTAPRRY